MDELRRQAVHISGLLFVIIAQFTDKWVAASYFLLIAVTFFVYSEHMRRERKRLHIFMQRFEERFRGALLALERADAPRPFHGAFWFFAGCGLAFLLFPHNTASAASAMLAAGDGMSTIVGVRWGSHKLLGRKSFEGSLAMLIFSLIAGMFFVGLPAAAIGAAAATLFELLPEAGFFRRQRRLGAIDDNLLVPIASGAVMLAVSFIL